MFVIPPPRGPSPAIVHRDLSSRNVLYDGRTAKLADLGQAKAMGVAVAAAGSRQTAMPGAMVRGCLSHVSCNLPGVPHNPFVRQKNALFRREFLLLVRRTCVTWEIIQKRNISWQFSASIPWFVAQALVATYLRSVAIPAPNR